MSKFSEVVTPNTPQVFVAYRKEGSKHLLNFGQVGQMPILQLVGFIGGVQNTLQSSRYGDGQLDLPSERWCEHQALVIAWLENQQQFIWFIGNCMAKRRDLNGNEVNCLEPPPVDSICGMLEVVKTNLLAAQLQQMMQQQTPRLFGPDGLPMRSN